VTGVTGTVPVSPSTAGLFSGNIWSGNISLGAPGTGVFLVAAQSNGAFGVSAALNVAGTNDLVLDTVAPDPDLPVGSTGSVNLVVSNTGPNGATGVIVTNQIPLSAHVGDVAVSQGSYSLNGNQLLLNFGTIGGGSYALASFNFTATTASTLSFTSLVGQIDGEAFLGNNRSVATVNFGDRLVRVLPTVVGEGGTNAVLTLQLDGPAPVPVSVNFSTVSDTAAAGEDFVPTNGIVTFPPFTLQQQVPVAIIDDKLFENRPYSLSPYEMPEQFWLEITPATNAAIAHPAALCQIQDDDPVPILSVSATNLAEGDAGTNPVPVIVRMSAPAGKPVDINYRKQTGTDYYTAHGGYLLLGTAIENVDFVGVTNSFYFAPGETQRVIYMQFIGDSTAEPDETFTLIVGSDVLMPAISVNRPFHVFQPITIVDDDPPVLALDDYQITAENCGAPNDTVDPGETVTVLLRVRNVGYNACTSSNLAATLLASGGVLNPSAPQNYGAMCGGAPEVWRPFTFTVGAACGSNVTATLVFTDDEDNRGTSSVNIPVGQRRRVLNGNVDNVPVPNLPPAWTANTYSDSPWYTTNEPPNVTNQFAHVSFRHQSGGTVSLVSPPFTIESSNAWLKLRHRFEFIPPSSGANLFFRVAGTYATASAQFSGSSRGWMVSTIPVPSESIGSAQSIYFELVHSQAPSLATWDIDSVEVFDGPASCCEAAASLFISARRANNKVELQWASVSNRTYYVQFRPSFSPTEAWMDSGAPIVAKGPFTAQTNIISAGNGFYRVRWEP
jgi:uncharacterized repeat protein (TIGR01451 family)